METFAGHKFERNGSWYAFYNSSVGPDTESHLWCHEHPTDPKWWGKPSDSNWICRHGFQAGGCPDGSCGKEPGDIVVQAEDVAATVRGLKRLLNHDQDIELDSGVDVAMKEMHRTVELIQQLDEALETEDLHVSAATVIVIDSETDKQTGTLRFDGGEWRYTPHSETSDD